MSRSGPRLAARPLALLLGVLKGTESGVGKEGCGVQPVDRRYRSVASSSLEGVQVKRSAP
jgi:hypothetical protein